MKYFSITLKLAVVCLGLSFLSFYSTLSYIFLCFTPNRRHTNTENIYTREWFLFHFALNSRPIVMKQADSTYNGTQTLLNKVIQMYTGM